MITEETIRELADQRHAPSRETPYSFFGAREDVEIHKIYGGENTTVYFVYSDKESRNRPFVQYRVARFFRPTGFIWVMGYDTYQTKFDEIPTEEAIEAQLETARTTWLSGKKVYG